MKKQPFTDNEHSLLLGFNNRDALAFGEVYNLYCVELLYFARQLYRETDITAEDVVHDTFIKIWKSRDLKFGGLINIKAYIIVSIKNGFLDYLKHRKQIRKFEQKMLSEPEQFIVEVIESEVLSMISEAIKILPSEMAKVFKLHLDGWTIKDIAVELKKTESTIYAQRREAILFLKKRLSSDQLLLFQMFFGI